MSESLDQKSGCLGFLVKLFHSGDTKNRAADGPWPFAKKKFLMSKAEFSFYRVLQQACGDRFVVCPKVGMGDLLYVKKGTEKRQGWRNKIDRKHIDFVLCHAGTMAIVAGVELDDASHQSDSAQKRDADKDKACKDAGLALIRFTAKRSYDPAAIAAELAKLGR